MKREFYNLLNEMLKIGNFAVLKKELFPSHRLHNVAYRMIIIKAQKSNTFQRNSKKAYNIL